MPANLTRDVIQNGYYRFVVVTDASYSEDDVFKLLEERNWQVRSIGVPPSEIAQVTANIAKSGVAVPKAFWIHATWVGPSLSLPIRDEPLYYSPVEQIFPDKPETITNTPNNTMISVLGFLAGAVLIGAGIWIYKSKDRF